MPLRKPLLCSAALCFLPFGSQFALAYSPPAVQPASAPPDSPSEGSVALTPSDGGAIGFGLVLSGDAA